MVRSRRFARFPSPVCTGEEGRSAAFAPHKPDVGSRYESHSAQGDAGVPSSTIKIPSSSGGMFDCYLALPASATKTPAPAIVLACAIVGVDEDMRVIADVFAARGY